MEIHFQTEKLRKIIEDESLLTRKHGELARKITQRYKELQAADCLQDMPPAAGTHPLHNNRDGQYGLTLKQPYRMIIRPVGDFNPPDTASIVAIEIIEITDYH
ncbi:MAG: killer suppression protein HigA [Candidatus Gracilibacteria bacterium]|jgi:plasmid maintenance system killer protein